MLVNLKEMLLRAEAGHYGVGCFNTPNLETIQAVIAAAEEENLPVILAHAQSMDPPAVLEEIAPAMLDSARRASVPVCVHLDHGKDRDYVERAMELGFSSVMFDVSEKSFEENADQIQKLCRIAHARQITVEAELGILTAASAGPDGDAALPPGTASSPYTDPLQAAEFARLTDVDALTVCFGTAHGQYTAPPRLDIERVRRIRQCLKARCRIVMHGASGVDDDQIRAAIKAGVSKINYYSGISRGCSQYIYSQLKSCGGNMHWHTVHRQAMQFMKRHVQEKIRLFAGRETLSYIDSPL
ncbi:MAG: class II fructose-bisphosphate aldolase [Lachnospiraceae bacterium]|nr:class II fructose-bisphosphate aldolase [Lachnospiraceae bacterium]